MENCCWIGSNFGDNNSLYLQYTSLQGRKETIKDNRRISSKYSTRYQFCLFDKAFGRIVALENKFNGSEKPDIIADLEHKGVCYYNFSQRANANENTRDENLNNALISFNKALKVFTKEKYPTQYASTNTNIGVIYATFLNTRIG